MSCDNLSSDAKKALKKASGSGANVAVPNATSLSVRNELQNATMINQFGVLTPAGRDCRKRLIDRDQAIL